MRTLCTELVQVHFASLRTRLGFEIMVARHLVLLAALLARRSPGSRFANRPECQIVIDCCHLRKM
jgi:hypothetical protein